MQLCLMIEGQEDVTWDDWVALAETCEASGVEALFRSAAFYDDRVIGAQIKSPVQLVAQAMRQLKATVEPPMLLTSLTKK